VNLQELRYFSAVAEHRHFGRAARACYVSQPTLSGQIRKMEEDLGVILFERNNRRVALTPIGEKLLEHAKKALEEAGMVEAVALASRDQLAGPLRLGVIPTLAPYLVPLILDPLRRACPKMVVELWEDLTPSLLELLRGQRLDAALIATEHPEEDLTTIPLFVEPFLAALPPAHRLARTKAVSEAELGPDLLVLADGHCLAMQALRACGHARTPQGAFRAASLETLLSLVEAGYGVTLVPELAVESLRGRKVVFRPITEAPSRTIRLVSRPGFPRPAALQAAANVIRETMSRYQ
jgi:LysR family hydrogen peroxide-inducible transcriptional activator